VGSSLIPAKPASSVRVARRALELATREVHPRNGHGADIIIRNSFQVLTEGRLILEFTFDDLMRIKSWHMSVRTHRELVPRSVISMQQDPAILEQLSKNITRMGMSNATLNYLRVRTYDSDIQRAV